MENRIHRALWGLAVLVGVAVVSWGQAQGVSEEIRAKKFIVVNEMGTQVVLATSDSEGQGLLVIYNKGGKPSIIASSGVKRGAMFRYRDGKRIVAVGPYDGSGRLWILGEEYGSVQATAKFGRGEIVVTNKDGVGLTTMQATNIFGSGGSVFVRNNTGAIVNELAVDKDGAGWVFTTAP